MTESINKGWIKLHRQFLDWEWYSDIPCKVLFVHLLLLANHDAQKWHGQTVERGQFISGRIQLAKQTGLSQQQTRTALTKLKSTSEITIKSTNSFSLISICNYNKYQPLPTNESTSKSTNDQPAINQPSTTNKNVKNEKNLRTTTVGLEKDLLTKWLSRFEGIKSPEGLAYTYRKKYPEEAINRALRNSICTSTSAFTRLCEKYSI